MAVVDQLGGLAETGAQVVERLRHLGRLWAEVPRIPTTANLAERSALVTLLFGPRDGASARAAVAGAEEARIVELAAQYATLAPLAEALSSPGLAGVVAPATLEALKERRLGALLQNRLLLADAATIAQTLGRAGIGHLFLKGTVLLASYPSLAARHVDDIDLLVRVADAPRVGAALAAAGFDVRESGRMRHPLIATGPRGTLVEIHHGLDDGLDEGLWDRARTVEAVGAALVVPSVDDLFAHLSHHVLVQHARAPRYLLRHLFDVAALVDGGAPRPSGPTPLATSIELLELVRDAARSPPLAKLLGALLFPTRHSTLHLAVARRFRLGFRGLGTELRALKNVPQYLVYDVDDHD